MALYVTPKNLFESVVCGISLVACGERVPPNAQAAPETPMTPSALESPSAVLATDAAPNPNDIRPCPANVGMISDGESQNRTNFIEGRGGYWYTYTDGKGSVVAPPPGSEGGTFTMSSGGANGSTHAARMTGTLGTAARPLPARSFGGSADGASPPQPARAPRHRAAKSGTVKAETG